MEWKGKEAMIDYYDIYSAMHYLYAILSNSEKKLHQKAEKTIKQNTIKTKNY